MSFKIFLIWSSGGPPVQWSETIYAVLKKGIMGNIYVKLFEIWTSGSGDVVIYISNLELLQPRCLVDWNYLCNLGRRHHKEQSCEIILNFNQCFMRKCCLKLFLIWSSGSPFTRRSVIICAILAEGILRNDFVKIFCIWVGR